MPETTLCRRLYRCQCAWEEMPGSPRLAVSPREQQVPRPSYTSLSDERHILNFSTIIKLKLWNFYYYYILYGHPGTTISYNPFRWRPRVPMSGAGAVSFPCRICKKETGGAPVCPFCGLKQGSKSNIWSAGACPAGGRPTDPNLHFSIFSPSNAKDVSFQDGLALLTPTLPHSHSTLAFSAAIPSLLVLVTQLCRALRGRHHRLRVPASISVRGMPLQLFSTV